MCVFSQNVIFNTYWKPKGSQLSPARFGQGRCNHLLPVLPLPSNPISPSHLVPTTIRPPPQLPAPSDSFVPRRWQLRFFVRGAVAVAVAVAAVGAERRHAIDARLRRRRPLTHTTRVPDLLGRSSPGGRGRAGAAAGLRPGCGGHCGALEAGSGHMLSRLTQVSPRPEDGATHAYSASVAQ